MKAMENVTRRAIYLRVFIYIAMPRVRKLPMTQRAAFDKTLSDAGRFAQLSRRRLVCVQNLRSCSGTSLCFLGRGAGLSKHGKSCYNLLGIETVHSQVAPAACRTTSSLSPIIVARHLPPQARGYLYRIERKREAAPCPPEEQKMTKSG